MENGATKAVKDGVLDKKVEEKKVLVGLESKDVEDEVFEEAVDTPPDRLPDQETKIESGVGVRVVGGSGSGSGPVVVNENSSQNVETESFEEAIGVTDKVINVAVVGEDKVVDLLGGKSDDGVVVLDKIDEGGTVKEVVSGKLNKGTEIAEAGHKGESDVSKAEVEKPENGKSDKSVSSVEGVKLENGNTSADVNNSKIKSSEEVLPEDGESRVFKGSKLGAEYEGDMIAKSVNASADTHRELPDNKGEELNGNLVNTEQLKNKSAVLKEVDGSAGTHMELPDNKGEELNGNLVNAEQLKNKSSELKKIDDSAGSHMELPDNKGEDLNCNLVNTEQLKDKSAELKNVDDSAGTHIVLPDNKGEEPNGNLVNTEQLKNGISELKKVDASSDTHTGHIDKKGKEPNGNLVNTEQLKDKSAELKNATCFLGSAIDVGEEAGDSSVKIVTEHQNESNGEVKDMLAGQDSKHLEGTCEPEGKSASFDDAVGKGTVAPEIGSSPSLGNSTCERNEKIQAGTTGFSSKSPTPPAGEIVHKDHVLHEGPAKKTEKNEEENKSTPVITERKINPEPVLPSAPPMKFQFGTADSSSKSRPQRAEEIAHVLPEGPGKKAEKEQKVNQSSQVISERKIHPAPEHASSAAKSTTPAPPPARPAGLGRAAPLLEPATRVVQQPRVNGSVSHAQTQQIEDSGNGEVEECDETREKLQMIRVKFLRLAHRLGQTPHNVVVAQVLYRLGLAEQLRGGNGGRVGAFSFDRASAMAEQLESAGQAPLDFSCTIMVLGKTGVGKSATINSIFDEVKFGTDAFQMGTKKVQDVVGTVQGIKVRVIDTPGLLPSWSDQRQNEKILHSVKRFIKKTPPDIVLYLDRLDMQSRDFGDMPLLSTITDIFGPSIWFNAIVVLTHAASAPPDGPNGTASSYDMFVTQRSHVVQQAIRQAAGDMRLMNPVSLVENHSACRTNRAGQRVLPNGQVWKPHLLLLSFASKILAEANTLLKLQDSPPGKPLTTRSRAPPLPFLLSSLLQSRPQVKLPDEQFGDEDGLDDELDDSSDSEDESEFDELPPFKHLTKAQIAKLSKAQKKAYFDELEYREKLFMKKQLKEEKRRRKIMKKMAAAAKDLPSDYSENVEEESSGAASVPVPMPDLPLPASFDSDNPTHRYRYLDSSNQWLVRPVLETHGWDHDVGYEGINAERLFVVKDKIPLSFSSQITKDKKDANVQMELGSTIKHGEGKATSVGFDMQTVGKDLAYTLRSETRFSNFRRNKATAGLSVTHLGDSVSAGVKVEDKLIVNKRFRVVMTGGAMTSRSDVAYGGSLEAQLRDKDFPLGRALSTLGLSVMDWHGDLAVGCNVQSQIPIGRSTNLIGRANLNNRGAGQVSIRLNSSEQLQIALIALIPLLKKVFGYPQQMQYGQ